MIINSEFDKFLISNVICELHIDENNQVELKNQNDKVVDLNSEKEENPKQNFKRIIDKLKGQYNAIRVENEGKKCDGYNEGPILWILIKKQADTSKEYLQVGHSDSVELMFNGDIKYDVYDLCYGDGRQKGKYYALRERNCTFTFYSVNIDDFVSQINKLIESGQITFDQEIIDALNKTDVINKTIRVNCAEALLASVLDCSLWHPAPQSGEKYYRKYLKEILKEE